MKRGDSALFHVALFAPVGAFNPDTANPNGNFSLWKRNSLASPAFRPVERWAGQRMPQARVETAPRSEAPRIIVAEDEALVRFAIAEALRELGASVVEAASADEAWQYFTAGGTADLVFTDHLMPGSMTGAQLAARIRLNYPIIIVVVTSGHFNDPSWSEPVVAKPYDLYETATALVERARNARPKEGEP